MSRSRRDAVNLLRQPNLTGEPQKRQAIKEVEKHKAATKSLIPLGLFFLVHTVGYKSGVQKLNWARRHEILSESRLQVTLLLALAHSGILEAHMSKHDPGIAWEWATLLIRHYTLIVPKTH